MPSFKEQEKQRRENEIVQHARQIMLERSYANLNMDELAERVGISKPTLYQHFKSKEDLAARVILQDFQAVKANYEQPFEGTALERLTETFRVMFKKRYALGNVLNNFGFEVVQIMHTNPELKAYREQGLKFFHSLVDDAKAEGEINDDLPTLIIVRSMFMLQNVLSDPFHKDTPPLEEEALDQAIEAVIQLFLKGITR